MCGIVGILRSDKRPVPVPALRAMCSSIAHRGPDDEGLYVGSGIGLGMRRLSIIDLESGQQPVRNEDGSVCVVFNGEIYNYRELRARMQGRGHIFHTRGDTETILHLYEEYGKDCVHYLRGMFAFAVWDDRQRQLLVARDRLGIKPLYYAEKDGQLVFASELKALLQLPEVDRRLNWNAAAHLFTFMHTPSDESIIEGVHKLEPGHLLLASPGEPAVIERYWDLDFVPEEGKPERYFIERLRELLDESVRLHLVSDVPLGSFLSGGIDSSSVVATAARSMREPLNTFSIGFSEKGYNELDAARLVATKFQTNQHDQVLEPEILGDLESLAWYLDEPFGDSSAIPTYMVSKLASRHVKVVLSGDGGDELFAGYDKYIVEGRERSRPRLPSPVRSVLRGIGSALPQGARGRNFLRHLSLIGVQRYFDSGTLFRFDDMKRLFRPGAYEMLSQAEPWREWAGRLPAEPGRHWLSELQYLDLHGYLPLDILTKVDRMSMAHSIETRVPLLDHKLVEFASTIPPQLHWKDGRTKYVLKEAMRGILPDEIIDRPKHGFAVPLSVWFRGRLGEFARKLLLDPDSGRREILNRDYVGGLIRLHEKRGDLDLHLWTLLSFELWARLFLDRNGAMSTLAA